MQVMALKEKINYGEGWTTNYNIFIQLNQIVPIRIILF